MATWFTNTSYYTSDFSFCGGAHVQIKNSPSIMKALWIFISNYQIILVIIIFLAFLFLLGLFLVINISFQCINQDTEIIAKSSCVNDFFPQRRFFPLLRLPVKSLLLCIEVCLMWIWKPWVECWTQKVSWNTHGSASLALGPLQWKKLVLRLSHCMGFLPPIRSTSDQGDPFLSLNRF